MTHCRARTTRGDPVTFEFHDHGEVESHDNVRKIARELVSEMVGEGFHCVSGHRFEGADGRSRMEFDRQSLERAGIDTETVAVCDSWSPDLWTLLWPPPLRSAEVEVSAEMVDAGEKAWEEIWPAGKAIRRSMLPAIFRAMESAR